jgi:putative tricarboxylic transport membrane protein
MVGSYSLENNMFQVYAFIGFGVFGYFVRKLKFEPGPMLMSFILAPLMENSLRQSLLMSQGSFNIFFARPISCVFMIIFFAVLISQVGGRVWKKFGKKAAAV